MLIEVDDPRTANVMGLLQHCNSSELKELLNEDTRLDFLIRDSQLVQSSIRFIFTISFLLTDLFNT